MRLELLLLCILVLSALVHSTESACHASHSGAGSSSFTGVSPDSTADGAQRSTAGCTLHNVALRGLIRLRIERTGVAWVGNAWIESGLSDSPSMAFVTILILLRLTLILLRINKHAAALRPSIRWN